MATVTYFDCLCFEKHTGRTIEIFFRRVFNYTDSESIIFMSASWKILVLKFRFCKKIKTCLTKIVQFIVASRKISEWKLFLFQRKIEMKTVFTFLGVSEICRLFRRRRSENLQDRHCKLFFNFHLYGKIFYWVFIKGSAVLTQPCRKMKVA